MFCETVNVNNFNKMLVTQVEESDGQAESESGVPVDYSFSNFSFKVLLSHHFPVKNQFCSEYTSVSI